LGPGAYYDGKSTLQILPKNYSKPEKIPFPRDHPPSFRIDPAPGVGHYDIDIVNSLRQGMGEKGRGDSIFVSRVR